MGRLIDADALLKEINGCVFTADMTTTLAVSMACRWIENAPTVDVTDINVGDLISRKDAVNVLKAIPRLILDPKGEFQPVEPPTKSMIDPDDAVAAIAKLQQVAVSCKDCKYAIKNDDMYWICKHPNNNAWNIDKNFFCGHGVKNE